MVFLCRYKWYIESKNDEWTRILGKVQGGSERGVAVEVEVDVDVEEEKEELVVKEARS